MKIERTKNAARGIAAGIILRAHQTIVPFIMRTIMLYYLGIQYLGLNSLFASVLHVLNLAELGVGYAMVYSMYKPISDDNVTEICALMKLYKVYYRVIGAVIGAVGLALLPFIKYLIKGDIPSDVNLYILYLLNLFSTVLTYWLFAYKNSLLQAHQRVDVISLISLGIETIKFVFQIIAVIGFRNYYVYLVLSILCQVLNNLFTAVVVSKMFPGYEAKGVLEKDKVKEINSRIRDLFTSKVGGVVLNSADSIVISTFLGLAYLAIYQNYFYLLSAIIAIVQIIFSAIMAGLGNSFLVDNKEKIFVDFMKFNFLFNWLISFCTICFLCLFQPFMKIWVGEKLMLGIGAVVFFCIYFYFYEINRFLNVYKDAAGLWHKDRFRPLTAALVNLLLNVLLVNWWGLYGVIFSTVFSILFVEMPWLIHNLFTVFFDHKYRDRFVKKNAIYCLITICVALVTYYLCDCFKMDNDWLVLIIRGIICVIVPNILFIIVYHRTQEYLMGKRVLLKMSSGLNFLSKTS